MLALRRIAVLWKLGLLRLIRSDVALDKRKQYGSFLLYKGAGNMLLVIVAQLSLSRQTESVTCKYRVSISKYGQL